jgi:hypothetical protein
MALPEFVEVDGRLFEVRVVAGPLAASTIVCRTEQVILVSDDIPEDEQPAAVERAVSAALGLPAFRPVPVVGSIS